MRQRINIVYEKGQGKELWLPTEGRTKEPGAPARRKLQMVLSPCLARTAASNVRAASSSLLKEPKKWSLPFSWLLAENWPLALLSDTPRKRVMQVPPYTKHFTSFFLVSDQGLDSRWTTLVHLTQPQIEAERSTTHFMHGMDTRVKDRYTRQITRLDPRIDRTVS